VRGTDRQWVRKLYGFALVPDLILYLNISVPKLIPRVLARGGFDYWESGADFLRENDMYDCFVKYQSALLKEFESMVEEFGFTVVDADAPIKKVFEDLRQHVTEVVRDMTPGEAMLTGFPGELPPPPQQVEPDRRALADMLRDFFSSLLDDT
jgi:dTMP kinase